MPDGGNKLNVSWDLLQKVFGLREQCLSFLCRKTKRLTDSFSFSVTGEDMWPHRFCVEVTEVAVWWTQQSLIYFCVCLEKEHQQPERNSILLASAACCCSALDCPDYKLVFYDHSDMKRSNITTSHSTTLSFQMAQKQAVCESYADQWIWKKF